MIVSFCALLITWWFILHNLIVRVDNNILPLSSSSSSLIIYPPLLRSEGNPDLCQLQVTPSWGRVFSHHEQVENLSSRNHTETIVPVYIGVVSDHMITVWPHSYIILIIICIYSYYSAVFLPVCIHRRPFFKFLRHTASRARVYCAHAYNECCLKRGVPARRR